MLTSDEDRDLLERFHRRLAGIEAEVNDAPARVRPRIRVALGRGAEPSNVWRTLAVPVVAGITLVGLLILGLPLIASRPPIGSGSPPPTSRPTASPQVVLTGPARLVVSFSRELRALPPGIITSGIDLSTYVARVSDVHGQEIASWSLGMGPQGGRGAVPESVLNPGAFRVTVARIVIVDNVDTGARSSTPPFGECVTEVTLEPGTTTHLAATFPIDGESCTIGTPTSEPTTAIEVCATVALDYAGKVVGAFDTTVAGLRRVEPLPASSDKWPALTPDHAAVLCYVDGAVGISLPPDASAKASEPFDRVVVAVVDGASQVVVAGYHASLPVRAP